MTKRSKAYTEAGVDIEAGNQFVKGIRDMVAGTFTPGVLTGIGGFGGLFRLDTTGMREPVLVGATDGVGTKLKLAFATGIHHTIGIDLVAMSVNDVLVQGARPLFFLDYFATGKLEGDTATQVVSGVADGCRQAGCALLGGETAEMPDFYAPGEYDLSGFCVGVVDRQALVDGSAVSPGDALVGLASSGLHSNGYSLVRKLVRQEGLDLGGAFPGEDRPAGEVLIEPTRIYVKPVLGLLENVRVKGMVHVTGGGFYDNIPRILPETVTARIAFDSWDRLPVFDWLRTAGNLSWPEMLQIFNCGVGFVLVVDATDSRDVVEFLTDKGQKAWEIGTIRGRNGDEEQVEMIF
ncbi:MAG: phosphoribosylformylglycinamidine cyclo-ligase [Desulfohalobiaceae bacterium]